MAIVLFLLFFSVDLTFFKIKGWVKEIETIIWLANYISQLFKIFRKH
jgi:hypothetical protein